MCICMICLCEEDNQTIHQWTILTIARNNPKGAQIYRLKWVRTNYSITRIWAFSFDLIRNVPFPILFEFIFPGPNSPLTLPFVS